MKIGMAFSGGGAKGAFHLGAVESLNNKGIDIHSYSGTSSGSIIATLKALGRSNEECLELIKKINSSLLDVNFINLAFGVFNKFENVDSLFLGRKIMNLFTELFGDLTFNDVKKPLFITTTDIVSGNQVVFSNQKIKNPEDANAIMVEGSSILLRDAVYASCALPGIFPIKEIKGFQLVDGSLTNNVPADLLDLIDVDKIIGIQLNQMESGAEVVNGLLNTLERALNILITQNQTASFRRISKPYIILNPNITDVSSLSFNKAMSAYNQGRKYVEVNFDNISKFLEKPL